MKNNIITDLINLAFPNCCYHCNRYIENEKYICTKCFNSLDKTNYHKNPKTNELYQFIKRYVKIKNAFSLYYFRDFGVLQTLIHNLKYYNKKNIGTWLGEIYGQILVEETNFNFDLIIPIPLHKKRELKRGYNQSEIIANGLNKYLQNKVLTSAVCRIKNTDSQTTKDKEKRRIDLLNAFEIIDKNILENKHILLVDDIITTGSTIIECASTIKKSINCEITICSIGKTI